MSRLAVVRTRVRAVRAALTTAAGRHLGDLAAESAFFLALAVLPMLLTTTGLLRTLRPLLGRDAYPTVEHGLATLLHVVLTPAGTTAADAADQLLESGGGVLSLGSVASVLVVTRALRSLLTALHGLQPQTGAVSPVRAPWGRALGLGVLTVGLTALALAMVAVGPFLGHARDLGAASVVDATWAVLRWPVTALAGIGYLALLHGAALGRVAWRPALAGAVAGAVGAAAATGLLPVYVDVARRFSPTTGALGGGLILLLWAYLLALSVLLGAQLRVRLAAG